MLEGWLSDFLLLHLPYAQREAVCLLRLVLTLAPDRVCAQFTDPRTYTNSPVGTNQVELLYAYARSNTSIDSSLIVDGAKFHLNQGVLSYTRYFGLKDHLAWVEPSLPIAGLSGSISGTNISGSVTGRGFELSNGHAAEGRTCVEHFGV
jgi:hypothetical protein